MQYDPVTVEQFKLLRAGDVVVDLASSRRTRKIHKVSRVHGRHGQAGKTRVGLTVDNLKSNGKTTIIFVSDETGALRFEFP